MAAKKKTSKLDFKINEHVVYPSHGVGKVLSVEDEEIAGAKLNSTSFPLRRKK